MGKHAQVNSGNHRYPATKSYKDLIRTCKMYQDTIRSIMMYDHSYIILNKNFYASHSLKQQDNSCKIRCKIMQDIIIKIMSRSCKILLSRSFKTIFTRSYIRL